MVYALVLQAQEERMADDASKPKPKAEPRPVLLARPRPDRDPVQAGREAMDRHPIVMARLAE